MHRSTIIKNLWPRMCVCACQVLDVLDVDNINLEIALE